MDRNLWVRGGVSSAAIVLSCLGAFAVWHSTPARERTGHTVTHAGSRVGQASAARAISPRRLALETARATRDASYAVLAADEGMRAENEAQGFGVSVERGRAVVADPRAGYSLALELAAIGRAGAIAPATQAARVEGEANRIRVVRDGLLEWFANGPLGLEQGFELARRPEGAGPLRVELTVDGLSPVARDGFVALHDAGGDERLRYSDLFALDAEGDELPATLAVEGGRIVLSVDDRDATYPVVIDPLIATQQARLGAADVPMGGRFGTSLYATNTGVQGAWVVAGASSDDRAATDAGAAYVYRRNAAGTGYDLIARLQASDAEAGAHFGASVLVAVLSGTQVGVLVGAPDRAAGGKVYFYAFTSATNAWSAAANWVAPGGGVAGDQYGSALSYNASVGTAAFAVGAPGGNGGIGAVHVYRGQTFEATLLPVGGASGDRFGAALASSYTDAGALLIGSPGDDASAAITDAGSIYGFVRTAGPPATWAQEAKFAHASPVASARLGASIARISDAQYLVGEPVRANGAVHRIARTNGTLAIATTITAADGAAGDGFGTCVSFGEAGTTDDVIVGSPGVDTAALLGGQGALYRYTLDAALSLTFVERFTGASPGLAAGTACALPASNGPRTALFGVPYDDTEGTDAGAVYVENLATNSSEANLVPHGVRTNQLARAVAISGDTVALGAPYDDQAGGNYGAVYVFVRTGATYTQQAKILAPAGQLFGGSLALDGNVLVVGSAGGTMNMAWVSRRTGASWSTPVGLFPMASTAGDAFGTSVALSNGTLAVGAPGVDGAGSGRGAVVVFTDDGTAFTQQAVLTASNGQDQDAFGYAVAIDGNLVVAGAPGRDGGGGAVDIGVAYVYSRTAATWTEQATLAGPSTAGTAFGKAVAIRGTRVAVGGPARPIGGVSVGVGSVRTFVQNGFTWPLEASLALAGGVTGDEFGAALALRDSILAVGAPGRDGTFTDGGAVVPYLFSGATWTVQAALAVPATDDAAGDDFGRSVALDAGLLVTGAPLVDVDAIDAGSAYVHLLTRSSGESCLSASECNSGYCVDGVCCNVACGGGAANDCQACSAAAGGTTNGTCTALTAAAAPTVTCRAASATGCDVAETCAAGNAACPVDGYATNGSNCGGAPSGACDGQDLCLNGACLPVYASSGTPCRAANGICDLPESCTGSSASCPADLFAPDGSGCGGGTNGACDVMDQCMAGTCVALVSPTGTPCRASNGECDATESCDGIGTQCPADDPRALEGAPCGGAPSGLCDAQDLCSSGSCQPTYASTGTSCRASTGACDAAEVCTGANAACPADVNGCCTADAQCNDGNPCTADHCNLGTGACVADAPTPGCCVADADCGAGTTCMPVTCNTSANACQTSDLGPSCCDTAADCDDADPCTIDDCSGNACSHATDPMCMTGDAGVPMDAGVGADAGSGTDAGTVGTDAGAVGTDAGTVGTDAGTVGTDAGTVGTDAGSDAGTGQVDGGSTGGPTSEGGCSCTTAGRTPDLGSLWGGALVLGLTLALRRTRRH